MQIQKENFYEGLDLLEEDLESEEIDEEKIQKQYAEREKLQRDLENGEYHYLKTRVAYILSRFPECRDSDILLQLKYWEEFEGYKLGAMISPEELIKFERLTSIARARAKIQNEYRLYQASPEVKKYRNRRQETFKEVVLQDQASYPSITVFCDESGKTQDYLVIGGMWVLGSETRSEINQFLSEWKSNHPKPEIRRLDEFHLTKMKKFHKDIYIDFFRECIQRFGGSVSFKAIAILRTGSRANITQMVYKLLSLSVLQGLSHELKTGRIEAPCRIKIFKDKENTDVMELTSINYDLHVRLHKEYDMNGTKVWFEEVSSLDSHSDYCIQVADIFTGAVGRLLNSNNDNYKDDFARELLSLMGIEELDKDKLRIGSNRNDFVEIEILDG